MYFKVAVAAAEYYFRLVHVIVFKVRKVKIYLQTKFDDIS